MVSPDKTGEITGANRNKTENIPLPNDKEGIGGVHTIEQARRKGYARQVVRKAVNMLVEAGHIPRYQTDATNTPSIQLAESIGLQPYLRLEHYLATPKS